MGEVIKQRRLTLDGSREAAMAEEVVDALRATPEERMRAAEKLLDTAYDLLRREATADGGALCRFPGFVQERRPGLR